MTYTNVLAVALLVAAPVAAWTLHRLGVRPVAYVRARARRGGEARLRAAIRRYGADGWRVQDGASLWHRGVHR